MSQELQVPAVFQNRGMAKAFQGHVNPNEDSLADGIAQGYPVIAYRGKIWALRHRGERKIVTRPDDGSPSGHLDLIILGQGKGKSKSFYKKWDPSTSEGERPICSSIDGIVPDLDVTAKQSETCALCPRNVWKTDPDTGRRGRECTDYKRLAVLVMPTQTKPLFGEPLMEPMFLRVPPDSLNSLAIMGDTMSNQGYHYSTYLTRVSFDPNKAHPCMQFRPLQPLNDQEAEVVLELRSQPLVGRITGGDVTSQGIRTVEQALAPAGSTATGLGAIATNVAPAPASSTPKTLLQHEHEQENVSIQPTGLSSGLLEEPTSSPSKATAHPATPKRSTSTSTRAKSGSTASTNPNPSLFGGANGASDSPTPSQLQTEIGSTEDDAGAAETSDDELDAEISKLIAKKK